MLIEKEKNEKKLWLASREGKVDDVKLLISSGSWIDVNCVAGEYQSTPLIEAAYQVHSEVVTFLLHKKADPNVADSRGKTPLYFAIIHNLFGCEEVIQLLLERGADPDKADKEGQTPLQFAAEEGHEDIVQLLRKWKIQILRLWKTDK